jgi:hypothetical protein
MSWLIDGGVLACVAADVAALPGAVVGMCWPSVGSTQFSVFDREHEDDVGVCCCVVVRACARKGESPRAWLCAGAGVCLRLSLRRREEHSDA